MRRRRWCGPDPVRARGLKISARRGAAQIGPLAPDQGLVGRWHDRRSAPVAALGQPTPQCLGVPPAVHDQVRRGGRRLATRLRARGSRPAPPATGRRGQDPRRASGGGGAGSPRRPPRRRTPRPAGRRCPARPDPARASSSRRRTPTRRRRAARCRHAGRSGRSGPAGRRCRTPPARPPPRGAGRRAAGPTRRGCREPRPRPASGRARLERDRWPRRSPRPGRAHAPARRRPTGAAGARPSIASKPSATHCSSSWVHSSVGAGTPATARARELAGLVEVGAGEAGLGLLAGRLEEDPAAVLAGQHGGEGRGEPGVLRLGVDDPRPEPGLDGVPEVRRQEAPVQALRGVPVGHLLEVRITARSGPVGRSACGVCHTCDPGTRTQPPPGRMEPDRDLRAKEGCDDPQRAGPPFRQRHHPAFPRRPRRVRRAVRPSRRGDPPLRGPAQRSGLGRRPGRPDVPGRLRTACDLRPRPRAGA